MTTRLGNAAGLRVGPYRATESIRAEVLRGLLDDPKSLPPKLFYDRTGARLFEAICELPEYYLTRTELGILRSHAREKLGDVKRFTNVIVGARIQTLDDIFG